MPRESVGARTACREYFADEMADVLHGIGLRPCRVFPAKAEQPEAAFHFGNDKQNFFAHRLGRSFINAYDALAICAAMRARFAATGKYERATRGLGWHGVRKRRHYRCSR